MTSQTKAISLFVSVVLSITPAQLLLVSKPYSVNIKMKGIE